MDAFSGYLYAALWLIIAVYLFYHGVKSNRFFFILSAFFLFMSGWYLADELLKDINLLEGSYGLIFRGVAVVVLIICGIAYYKNRNKKNNDDAEN